MLPTRSSPNRIPMQPITDRDIKKTVAELTDYMYADSHLFRDYYDSLSDEQEQRLENNLFNIIRNRFPKGTNK